MPERTVRAATGLAALAIVVTATALTQADGGPPATGQARERFTVEPASEVGTVAPGGAVTGTVEITSSATLARRITEVVFTDATSDACAKTGLALAPTVAVTPSSPLVIPPAGAAVLGWTGYMDGTGEDACQGATLTSEVLLDGEPAGTVTVTAGTLEPPPPPTGGATTGTRAGLRWSASTAAHPGWVLERAVAGTRDWQPACGSSPARPVRALACTDTGLTPRTAYVYRLTLRTGHWHATSRPSTPVVTQAPPIA